MKARKRNGAKVQPRDVRLYIPNPQTLEVWVDEVCALRLDVVRKLELDDGKRRTVVKVA